MTFPLPILPGNGARFPDEQCVIDGGGGRDTVVFRFASSDVGTVRGTEPGDRAR